MIATGTFGDHLKREREMRGVSLDEISAATRIGTRFLEALENEQWERLPGGVFNRGFVRAISRFLGLDEENMVAEYSLATNDAPSVAVWADTTARRSRIFSLILLVLAVLFVIAALGAGGWYGWRRYSAHRESLRVRPQTAASQTQAVPTNAPPVPGNPTPAPDGARPESLSSAPVPEPAKLELTISAGKNATLSIVADGKTLFEGRISAGETKRFEAREQFEVSTNHSGALLLELNGQTLAPLGPPGQPGHAALSRKDLKRPSGGPD